MAHAFCGISEEAHTIIQEEEEEDKKKHTLTLCQWCSVQCPQMTSAPHLRFKFKKGRALLLLPSPLIN